METITKEALIKWLEEEDNADFLNKVQEIKTEAEQRKKEFDQRVTNAYTPEEARAILHKHIDTLPWEK